MGNLDIVASTKQFLTVKIGIYRRVEWKFHWKAATLTGFITIAVGEKYLQMAVAFAISARRFNFLTILLHREVSISPHKHQFHKTVDISEHETINGEGRLGIFELKKLCYRYTREFDVCAFCDADSLVIRDPRKMFNLSEKLPVHTPGARTLKDHEKWGHPPEFTIREIAHEVGIANDEPIHTLNGGFLLWRRGDVAETWFLEFASLFEEIKAYYDLVTERNFQVRDELAMSLAFARQKLDLPRSDTSIGVWDAQQLTLDIEQQQLICKKGYYWQGHVFHPYIAHFGGNTIGEKYRQCVEFLQTTEPVELPLFRKEATTPVRHPESRMYNSYSIKPDDGDWLQEFVTTNGVKTVLEFGPGASTWSFLNAGCEVVSLEYQDHWFRHYQREFSDHPAVTIMRYENRGELIIPELDSRKFDLGFVDSPVGKLGAIYKKFARINSCEFVAAHTDLWLLHDARRPGEKNTLSVFEDKGWTVEFPSSNRNIAAVFRENHLQESPFSQVTQKSRRTYDMSHWSTLPKVSCQCITYGRPELLNEAVESFLRQDYCGEKELVILNDHPDITIEESSHPEIKVFNVERRFRSIGEKRNACCGLCVGDIIFPWDDDDISLPWRISYSLEQMQNHHYYKPDKLWYWTNGTISVREAVAHAMGAWSRDLFDDVGGYPHIQSGQDQGIENRFKAAGKRVVSKTADANLFYVYRFPGTGSYHLSTFGYNKGLEGAKAFVSKHVPNGLYSLAPTWHDDYNKLINQAIRSSRADQQSV